MEVGSVCHYDKRKVDFWWQACSVTQSFSNCLKQLCFLHVVMSVGWPTSYWLACSLLISYHGAPFIHLDLLILGIFSETKISQSGNTDAVYAKVLWPWCTPEVYALLDANATSIALKSPDPSVCDFLILELSISSFPQIAPQVSCICHLVPWETGTG